MFASVHRLPLPLFLLCAGCVIIVPLLIGGVFFAFKPAFQRFIKSTRGLIDLTLLTHLVIFAVAVVGILIGLGHLSPADLGLRWSDVPLAVLATGVIWLASQLGELSIAWLKTRSIERHPDWQEKKWTVQVGHLLGQLFGSALNEEIIYRGFLLVQCYLLLLSLNISPSWLALLIALLCTQSLFALFHLPMLFRQHTPVKRLPVNLLTFFMAGLLFSFLYLRTTNLLLVVGLHSLLNMPLPLVRGSKEPQLVVFLCVLLLLLGWQLFTGGF